MTRGIDLDGRPRIFTDVDVQREATTIAALRFAGEPASARIRINELATRGATTAQIAHVLGLADNAWLERNEPHVGGYRVVLPWEYR